MKKIIALAFVVILTLSLTACGKFTCDFCRKEKFGRKYTTEIFGIEFEYCSECKKTYEKGV